ncbi:MAG TPA: tyrosine--tRNA ligase [Candidatus Limnocylindrales bacterium]
MTAPDRVAGPIDRGPAGLLDELRWRGMLQEATPGLAARLATGRPISGYNGFDPSGPSLHVGSLVPVFGLLHLQRHGGRPVALLGGATGMVGDPSGRSAERNLLDSETLDANVAAIRRQLEQFLDSEGPNGALLVNNLDWLGEVRMLDFLRDVGKHFTIPYMLAKDSVQVRMGGGLSFTEFSYMLLQSADFLHLYRHHGVEMQMGGADQWGNITAGLELIRRVEAPGGGESPAHGIAYPLFTDPSGAKFGKTAEGTSVWLDPALTSPYEFYQYWLATEDADVGHRLRFFTLMEQEQILGLSAETEEAPELRSAQRALAYDVTRRVHGQEQADRVVAASEAAFASEPIVDPATLAAIHESAGGFEFTDQQRRAGSLAFVVDTGLVASRGEARRLIAGGGLTIGTVRVASQDDPVPEPIAGKWLVVRIGKRRLAVGRRQD